MSRVVLIDGHSLLFRAYHALPKTFKDRAGRPTNALYGFISMLLRLVEDLKPDFLAVAFDEKGPTFRHQELVTYKEGRPEPDADLVLQIPRLRELLDAFGVPVFSVEGYEGEDILATVVAKFKVQSSKFKDRQELEFFIVSGDRDVLQLVDDRVRVYSPKKGLSEPVIYSPDNVEEAFGVRASQIPDYKGLRGDPGDEIPGVFGLGEKTAAALINRFSSLEAVYRNLGQVQKEFGEAIVQKLADGAEMAMLSKKMATIVTSAPLTVKLAALKFSGLTKKEGLDYLRTLGFKSLLKRLDAHLTNGQTRLKI